MDEKQEYYIRKRSRAVALVARDGKILMERVFYFGTPWTQEQKDTVREAYPETAEVVFYAGLESTGLDWRYHERYYEMRDILEIYYMPGGTNGGKVK